MTRSWNNSASEPSTDFQVILDNMMNLDLLWWGSKQTGGSSSWYRMAVSHSNRTIKDFIRSDGSAYHEVIYNSRTGAVQTKIGDSGNYTRWSRGQAWGI